MAGSVVDQAFLVPAENDLSVSLLSELFGDNWWELTAQGMGSANLGLLGEMFAAYNAALLTFVAVLLVWQTSVGAMATSHEGRPLGSKYHTVWAPVRAPLALFLLTPIPAIKGLTILQALMMMATYMSIGIADTSWTAFSSYMQSNQQSFVTTQLSSGSTMADLKKMLVIKTMAMSVQKIDPGLQVSLDVGNWSWHGSDAAGTAILHVMQNGKPALGFGEIKVQCGAPPKGFMDSIGSGAMASWNSLVGAVQGSNPSAAGTAASSPACVASKKLVSDTLMSLNTASQNIIDSVEAGTAIDASAIKAASDAYQQGLLSLSQQLSGGANGGDAAATLQAEVSAFAAQSADLGWASSAMYFPVLSAIVSDTESLLKTITPEVTPPALGVTEPISTILADEDAQTRMTYGVHAADLRPYLQVMRAVLEMSASDAANATIQSGSANYDQWGINAWLGSILKGYTDGMAQGGNIMPFLAAQGAQAVDVGTTFVIVGAAGSVGGAIGGAALGGPAGAIIGAAAGQLGSLAIMLGVALVVEGAVLAYVLPFVPSIVMTMAIIGWMLLVAEMFVALPLFAAAHAFADGEGLASQKTGSGYAIIAGVLLRPAMLTFGFVFAYLLFSIGGKLLGVVLGMLFYVTAGTGVELVQFVSYLGVLVASVTTLVYFIARLITHLAEHVPQWVGGRGSDLGVDNAAREAAQQTTSMTRQGAGAVMSQPAGAATNPGDKVGRLIEQDNANKNKGGSKPSPAGEITQANITPKS